MLTITASNAVDLLREVVEEHGSDHRADGGEGGDGCRYVTDPYALTLVSVCIVGKVFDRLGILRALVDPDMGGDQFGACEVNREELWQRAEVFGVSFSIEAKRILRAAQSHQDAKRPWGLAVEAGILDFLSWQAHESYTNLGGTTWHIVKVEANGKTATDLVTDFHAEEEAERRQQEADEAEAEALRDMEDALSPVGSF